MRSNLKSSFGVCLCTVMLGLVVQSASAVVIYESASLGPIGQGGGFDADGDQFLGSRFSITDTVQVTAIGGHISLAAGIGDLFGAIVSLAGPNALPSGNPFDATTLASTVFTLSPPSSDVLIPLSVMLDPGDYAVIFGSGQLGATGGFGVMPGNNSDLPAGVDSYFFWTGTNWTNGGFNNVRFLVEGSLIQNTIPEPVTATLGLMGLATLGLATRRRVA